MKALIGDEAEIRKCTRCGYRTLNGKDGTPCPDCGARPCACPKCRDAEGYKADDPEVIDYDRRHIKGAA